MRNGKFTCALWGCGWVASGHLAAYLKNKDCEVIGIGSSRRESAMAKVAEFGGCDWKIYNTFEEILDALSDKAAMNIQMYLETPEALKEACRLYKKYDMYDKGYMTIADESVVEAVHAIDKDIAICLTPGWNERADEKSQRRCAELGCRFFQPIRTTLTPEKLRLAEELGLRANAFYADSELEFAELYDLRAPGIMTNAPARLVQWLKLQK